MRAKYIARQELDLWSILISHRDSRSCTAGLVLWWVTVLGQGNRLSM